MAKDNESIEGDLVGRDKIASVGDSKGSPSVEDIVAAKLRAKAEEARREAKEDARGGGRSGGIDFIGGSGTTLSGNVAGRDNVVTTTTTTGMTAADFAKIFETINAQVEKVPPAVKEDVRDAVETIKAEAQKEAVEGKPPDEKAVKMSSQALVSMAPDILEVAAATLANPAAGVALIIRKVLDRAKAMGSGAA
jgi:hypothetical protein